MKKKDSMLLMMSIGKLWPLKHFQCYMKRYMPLCALSNHQDQHAGPLPNNLLPANYSWKIFSSYYGFNSSLRLEFNVSSQSRDCKLYQASQASFWPMYWSARKPFARRLNILVVTHVMKRWRTVCQSHWEENHCLQEAEWALHQWVDLVQVPCQELKLDTLLEILQCSLQVWGAHSSSGFLKSHPPQEEV